MIRTFQEFSASLAAAATYTIVSQTIQSGKIWIVRAIGLVSSLGTPNHKMEITHDGGRYEIVGFGVHVFPVYYNPETGLWESPLILQGNVDVIVRNQSVTATGADAYIMVDELHAPRL